MVTKFLIVDLRIGIGASPWLTRLIEVHRERDADSVYNNFGVLRSTETAEDALWEAMKEAAILGVQPTRRSLCSVVVGGTDGPNGEWVPRIWFGPSRGVGHGAEWAIDPAYGGRSLETPERALPRIPHTDLGEFWARWRKHGLYIPLRRKPRA